MTQRRRFFRIMHKFTIIHIWLRSAIGKGNGRQRIATISPSRQRYHHLFIMWEAVTGLPPEDSETATPFVGSHFFPSRVSDKSGRYHRIWMEPRKIISHRLTLLIIPSVVHRTTRIWMEVGVIISHCWARHGSPPCSSYKLRLPPLFMPLSYACGTSNR